MFIYVFLLLRWQYNKTVQLCALPQGGFNHSLISQQLIQSLFQRLSGGLQGGGYAGVWDPGGAPRRGNPGVGGCSQTRQHNSYSNKLGTCCVCTAQPKLPVAQSLWQTELVQRQCRIRPVPTHPGGARVPPCSFCWEHGAPAQISISQALERQTNGKLISRFLNSFARS